MIQCLQMRIGNRQPETNYENHFYSLKMGIKRLNKFLTNKKICRSYQNIHEYVNRFRQSDKNNSHNGKIIVAVDFWLYAHKFLHSYISGNVLFGFWNQIIKLLSCGIIPLYVADGSVPTEKRNKISERVRKRKKIKQRVTEINNAIKNRYINIDDLFNNDATIEKLQSDRNKLQKQLKRIKSRELFNIFKMFDIFGVPYIRAQFEADAMCVKLFKEGIITSCLSDDMDMLALGCGSTIKFNNGRLIEFNLERIKKDLGLTQEQLVDMCMLFGCDYLRHSVRLECDDIYRIIKKHGSLLNALQSNEHKLFNMNNSNVKVIGENYYRVKDIYLNSYKKEHISDNLYNIKMKKINLSNVLSFASRMNWFNTSSVNTESIRNDIAIINNMIDHCAQLNRFN
jgi:flap endonuclease-1